MRFKRTTREQPDALAVREPTTDMEVLKVFIRLESDLLLGTELYGVGRRTAGKWKRYWLETENWCSVRDLNKDLKERRKRKARNKNTNKQTNERNNGRKIEDVRKYTNGDVLYILGAFTKLRKATISFVKSVSPSAWKSSAPTGRIFLKFGI
jgi:hypothetical protein